MGSCIAFNCTNRISKKIPGVTFHRFPKDETRRASWINAVRRENWVPSSVSRICSDHFPEHMMDRSSLACVRLRDGAVPSIFKFPPHLQKVIKERKCPFQRDSTQPSASSTSQMECQEIPDPPADNITESPTKLFYKRKVEELDDLVQIRNKKIKVLQQKVRRYKTKISTLKDLISDIKSKSFMDEDAIQILATVSEVNKEFLNRQLASAKATTMPSTFSPELRTFALTLHFYSPRAYEYVRSTFGLSLPHQRTLSRWYQHIDGAPGFTKETIDALKLKIENTSFPLFFSLIMDEMSIRQHVEFDGKETHGLINLGFDQNDDDSLPLAKDAFILLLVCINAHFKLPIAIFCVMV
ncbi:DNA transposase THAP9 [Araneus ventricosus]|uniref:DNA transposase THAP9 n=1 Tax=Araneus ventricosus TaxID=182803 RepID=A0A4Y2JG24_ARAVE|nr:DNA transposase THAP9 [Araneus ventricosus]